MPARMCASINPMMMLLSIMIGLALLSMVGASIAVGAAVAARLIVDGRGTSADLDVPSFMDETDNVVYMRRHR